MSLLKCIFGNSRHFKCMIFSQSLCVSPLCRTEEEAKQKTLSTWGPYTTTSGVAKSTGVEGITKKAKELNVYSS